MFDRSISLVGIDNFNLIVSKVVVVVGLGGVGGYAAESLVRSGIKKIILIDYDDISVSNLNRQIIATTNNIGLSKGEEFVKRIKIINSECEATFLNIFLNNDNINLLNNYQIDYIIDACDTVNAKKLLIDYSLKNNIKLISSMGTAKKMDPTKLKIMDIRKTSYDPLAKIIRKYVLSLKTNKKVMVVSSDEVPTNNKELASMIFVPATAGILCANYVITDIIKSE